MVSISDKMRVKIHIIIKTPLHQIYYSFLNGEKFMKYI